MEQTLREQIKSKLDVKKTKEFDESELVSLEKDLENKKRELEDTEYKIVANEGEIKRLEREIEVFKKISKIRLDNYGIIEPKHLWETKQEFWDTVKQKQMIDDERQVAVWENQIRDANRSVFNAKEGIKHIKSAMKFNEIDIAKIKEEMKK